MKNFPPTLVFYLLSSSLNKQVTSGFLEYYPEIYTAFLTCIYISPYKNLKKVFFPFLKKTS